MLLFFPPLVAFVIPSIVVALQTPANDLVLRAARGLEVSRVPVWLFRQAGRHLPEYNAYKEARGKHFLQLLEDPMDVAEVTMQPLRRYDVDAAILFSDILVVPQAVGVRVDMPGGKGIVVPEPVTTPDGAVELAKKCVSDPEATVAKHLKHVTRAVTEIRSAQLKEERDVTLLGFSASPWTLLFYTVGASSRDAEPALEFAKANPAATAELLDGYETLVAAYVDAQITHGAHAIQIFEAMGAGLDAESFRELALPRLINLGQNIKKKHPSLPLLVFARGVADPDGVNKALADTFDVITLDTNSDRRKYRRDFPTTCLQGNLDPKLLVPGTTTNEDDALDAALQQMLTDFGDTNRLIANIGEGLTGKEDPRLVTRFIDTLHRLSSSSS